ncbi:LysR family transcriptional regulator [Shewanella sp. D64]|uniref:LysR substrate-binding domain-containing protein n=1 Tax=unclassified Shewanella TaxID=196818 RepID=UPI0022BA2C2E|nr:MULTISPECIES: LysR substrate-binding domain-containing protein [unclassified Shewanella]MEC4725507.1 LysR family transcriptional regulator [Shewanella sp. D64]MEC4738674.1 LysR family transcriptional regulator [Shewanella sp. E94]WBJ94971.1 LysR family transcriptional regulator [Shewanella sp. MTB7]
MRSSKKEHSLLRTPHFAWLLAFKSVAEKQSFTLASRELHLTQPAVSQQVAKLESLFNVKLFFRDSKKVVLTEAGEQLLSQIETPFNRLMKVVETFQKVSDSCLLNIETEPVFSRVLISPELPKFLEENPQILFRQVLTTHHLDFLSETEVAIKWGDGKWDGVDAQFLCGLEYVPVCSPEYKAKMNISSLEDLNRTTLIHERDYNDWKHWLKYYPVAGLNLDQGHVIGESDVVMSMAVSGIGVALCGYDLIKEHLQSKKLIMLFPDLKVRHHKAYYILTRRHHELSAQSKLFIAFLHQIVLKNARIY